MNKTFKTFPIILGLLLVGLFLYVPAQATVPLGGLEVEFETELLPLFNQGNFLPNETITRWVKVTNHTLETKPIATEAINYPGFPDPGDVPANDLSRALLIVISEQGGADLYGGTSGTGEKYLFDFYSDGEVDLSDISSESFQTYDYEISFPSDKTDEWQTKTTFFDIIIGFQGIEGIEYGNGDNGNGNGNGGGGGVSPPGYPPGLFIADKSVRATTTQVTATITWQTSYSATSQVIYGTESEAHTLDLSDNSGTPPKYGYAHTTPEHDTAPKVKNHLVTVTGLTPNTMYYFRGVSHASLAISQEHTFNTLDEDGMLGGVGGPEEPATPETPEEGEEAGESEESDESDESEQGTEQEAGQEAGQEASPGAEQGLSLEGSTQETSSIEGTSTEEDTDLSSFLASIGMVWDGIRQSTFLIILVILLLLALILFIFRKRRRDKEEKNLDKQPRKS